MEQIHAEKQRQEQRQPDEEAEAKDLHNQELDDAIDGILDEIDEVLEVNAEEFVRSFTQKGGE